MVLNLLKLEIACRKAPNYFGKHYILQDGLGDGVGLMPSIVFYLVIVIINIAKKHLNVLENTKTGLNCLNSGWGYCQFRK